MKKIWNSKITGCLVVTATMYAVSYTAYLYCPFFIFIGVTFFSISGIVSVCKHVLWGNK